MYKKLLVAVDASEEASQVLAAAAALELDAAEVLVMHVAQPPPDVYGHWVTYLPIEEEQLLQDLLDKLDEHVARSDLAGAGTLVDMGRPAEAIVDHAQREQVDLIVLGSHGRHGIQLLLGSTANAVLHRAKCDVLAVRIREQKD